jgi:hypothetical protein
MMITTMFSTPLSSQIRDVCNDTWTITSLLLLGSVLSGLMPSLDPEPIVAALNARDVDYVVIGMFAANMADRELPPTYDIDFTPSATRENLDRLSDALRDLDARIRVDGMDEGLPFAHNGASLAGGGIWNLVCPHGEFDLSFIPSGTDGYPDLIQQPTCLDTRDLKRTSQRSRATMHLLQLRLRYPSSRRRPGFKRCCSSCH